MRSILLILGAAALSGLLLALSLPPSDIWWLGPICVSPLLAAVAGRGLLKGFLGGITVPFVAAAAVQSGLLFRVPHDEGNVDWLYTAFGFFGFVIALVACVGAESKREGWPRVFLLGAVAVILEFALFPVLPAHLALSQYRQAGVMMLASVGGLWVASLLLWAANAAIAEALRGGARRPAFTLGAILVVVYCVGLAPRVERGLLTKVSAVQTQATDQESLRKLNALAGKEGSTLAVWPEFSGLEVVPSGDTAGLKALSAKPGQPPFVTTFRDDFQPLPHNVAALFDGGTESNRYYKRKVFGGESKMHTPGTRAVAVRWLGHPMLGLSICFDSCYPRMISDTAGAGDVGLIALPTIDPDSTSGFVAAVHAAFTPFRAAECGLPIVRADGIACSQIVDNTGRIVAEMGPRKEGVLTGAVLTVRRWTLYSVLGDWVLYLCAAYVGIAMLGGWRRRPAKPGTEPNGYSRIDKDTTLPASSIS